MSRIVVQRAKSRWQDRMRDYRLIVDGSEVARVGNGEAATVSIKPGRHTVYMAIDWARSKSLEVTVAPEQTVQLECGPNAKPFLELVYALVLFRRWVWLRPANATGFNQQG